MTAMLGALAWCAPAQALDRYAVVHGCYAVSTAGKAVEGGPFRMQATTLAQYLLYAKDGRYLGAEGLASDVRMLIGNGYVPGHAELALDLVRENAAVRDLFEARID